MVKEANLSLSGSEPGWYESQADKGHVMRRAFCSDGGSPVLLINGARTDFRALYAGSLDDPSWCRPSRDIYVASAQPWDIMHPDLPKSAGMPER